MGPVIFARSYNARNAEKEIDSKIPCCAMGDWWKYTRFFFDNDRNRRQAPGDDGKSYHDYGATN